MNTIINKHINVINRFNADLERYHSATGDYDLPIIECSVIGYEPLEPAEIEQVKNGFNVELDGERYMVRVHDNDVFGWDDLKETIAYERRRLRKAWRAWQSGNPDAVIANPFQ